jgi:hypothetical protein
MADKFFGVTLESCSGGGTEGRTKSLIIDAEYSLKLGRSGKFWDLGASKANSKGQSEGNSEDHRSAK